MGETCNIESAVLEQWRSYLKLLASNQIDSWIGPQLDASDVVQETLAKAATCFDQYHGSNERELRGWLRAILKNNLRDARRRAARAKRDPRRHVSLDQEIDQSFRRVDAFLADSGSTPSHRAATNEQVQRLMAAMSQLPDAQRQVITLHRLQGLRISETAARLGRSSASVGGLLYRGLEQLHKLLAE